MYSTPFLKSNSHAYSGRKSSKRSRDGDAAPAQKPKKVNSEIRKQQNRIASRNYREKRKRKLQYLQQLLRDEPESQSNASSAESSQATRSRSVSTEYLGQYTPPPTSITLPSTPEYVTYSTALSSTAGALADSALAPTAPYHSPYPTPPLPVSTLDQTWSPPMPITQPLLMWNDTPWIATVDFSSPPIPNVEANSYHPYPYVSSTSSMYETLPISLPPVLDQHLAFPTRETLINDRYTQPRREPHQPLPIPDVSIHSSPSYTQITYH